MQDLASVWGAADSQHQRTPSAAALHQLCAQQTSRSLGRKLKAAPETEVAAADLHHPSEIKHRTMDVWLLFVFIAILHVCMCESITSLIEYKRSP